VLPPRTKIKEILLLRRILQGNIITGNISYGAYDKNGMLPSGEYYKRKL